MSLYWKKKRSRPWFLTIVRRAFDAFSNLLLRLYFYHSTFLFQIKTSFLSRIAPIWVQTWERYCARHSLRTFDAKRKLIFQGGGRFDVFFARRINISQRSPAPLTIYKVVIFSACWEAVQHHAIKMSSFYNRHIRAMNGCHAFVKLIYSKYWLFVGIGCLRACNEQCVHFECRKINSWHVLVFHSDLTNKYYGGTGHCQIKGERQMQKTSKRLMELKALLTHCWDELCSMMSHYTTYLLCFIQLIKRHLLNWLRHVQKSRNIPMKIVVADIAKYT